MRPIGAAAEASTDEAEADSEALPAFLADEDEAEGVADEDLEAQRDRQIAAE